MSEVLAPEELKDAAGGLTTDTLTRGTRLGRYELLVPIAMGGMAKVWAARQHGQRGFQKLVAIKTILPNLSEDPAFESMFLDEARIASNVHHPNVCDIYELGEEDNVLYMAMEWVNGDSLVRLLRASGGISERLDPRITARIIADACAGLHAAHELSDDMGRPLGVVHRDMSPHNILLSADGNVKLTDFGVAKAIGQLHDQTSTGTLKGKVNYMAPEQVTGTHIDRRSDIFALGCVLYEVTTGHLPFRARGEMDHQVLQRIIRGQFTPPSQVLPGYPRELEGIVLRAIANQPIQRFASAERMRMALEEWLQMSGPIVTQSHVAATVRARVGPAIDARRERIRVAMATTGGTDDTGATPNPSASGVVPAGAGTAAGQGGSRPGRRAGLAMSPLNQPIFVPPPPAPGPSGPSQGQGGLGATLALPRPDQGQSSGAVDLAQTAIGFAPSPFASRGPMPGPAVPVNTQSPFASTVQPGSQRTGAAPAPDPQPPGMSAPSFGQAPAMMAPAQARPAAPGAPPTGERPAAPGRHYLIASALGVLGAFALGVGVFFVWHWTRQAELGAPSSASTAPAVSVIVVPAPPPGITGAIPPTRPASAGAAASIDPSAAAPGASAEAPAPQEPAAAPPATGAAAPTGAANTAAPPEDQAPAAVEPAAPATGGGKAQAEPAPPSTAAGTAASPSSPPTAAPAVTTNATPAPSPAPASTETHHHHHHAEPAIPANPY